MAIFNSYVTNYQRVLTSSVSKQLRRVRSALFTTLKCTVTWGTSLMAVAFAWARIPEKHAGLSENWLVPLNPMVLLIIIPFLNGYFIGNINPTFSDKPMSSSSFDADFSSPSVLPPMRKSLVAKPRTTTVLKNLQMRLLGSICAFYWVLESKNCGPRKLVGYPWFCCGGTCHDLSLFFFFRWAPSGQSWAYQEYPLSHHNKSSIILCSWFGQSQFYHAKSSSPES